MAKNNEPEIYCSGCGRKLASNQPAIQIGGGRVLCHDCVKHAYDLFKAEGVYQTPESEMGTLENLPTPAELVAYLDEYIIGQTEAKRDLAVAVYNHYKRITHGDDGDGVQLSKTNVFCIGNSGCGKTFIAETIAKRLNVPFCIVDCCGLTDAGFVGDDVESAITRAYLAANGDVKACERAIIVLDEIDKKAKHSWNVNTTRDVGGEGVQQAFLKILEGTDVYIPLQPGRKHPEAPQIKINTKNILFICCGSFMGIEKILEKRLNTSNFGFITIEDESNKIDKDDIMKYVTHDDLREFGFIPEFIGRVPKITHVKPLGREALKRIIIEPKNSLFKQYAKIFALDNVKLTITDDVYDLIADVAIRLKTGARGLKAVMEDILSDYMFEAPSLPDNSEIVVTKEYSIKKLKEKNPNLLDGVE